MSRRTWFVLASNSWCWELPSVLRVMVVSITNIWGKLIALVIIVVINDMPVLAHHQHQGWGSLFLFLSTKLGCPGCQNGLDEQLVLVLRWLASRLLTADAHTEWLALRQEINDWALTKSTSTAIGGEQDFWCCADPWLKASIVLGHLGEADKVRLEVNAEVPDLELLNSQLQQTHTFS